MTYDIKHQASSIKIMTYDINISINININMMDDGDVRKMQTAE